MSDERKKSWREIDAGRDRGGAPAKRDPAARDRQKVEKSAAYSKYKSQLDKLFTPGGAALPESMRQKLGPTSPEAETRRRALDALKAAPNDQTLRELLEGGTPLPDDPRLLTSLLDVKDEALLEPVLEALAAAVASGKKPNRMLLVQKLNALVNRISNEGIIALAERLKSDLG